MASATMSSQSSYNDDEEEGPDDERLPQSQSHSQSQSQQTSHDPPGEEVVDVIDPEESQSATTNSVGPSPTTAKRTEMCEAQMVLLCLD